jgi:hypothetical protein
MDTSGSIYRLLTNNAVFWVVTPGGSCKNRHFGGTLRLHHQGDKHRRAVNNPMLITLMMEGLHSSETIVLKRATRRNIQEDGIIHSHSRENLKCYMKNTLPGVNTSEFLNYFS